MPVAYCTQTDILTQISQTDIIPFLDDYGTGNADYTLLNSIILNASDFVDGLLASIYTTPFPYPYPAKCRSATLVFTCYFLYQRRLTPDEKNPFKARKDLWEKTLLEIGNGTQELDANYPRQYQPGVDITYQSVLSVNPVTGQPITMM